jgi:hypothetical protein
MSKVTKDDLRKAAEELTGRPLVPAEFLGVRIGYAIANVLSKVGLSVPESYNVRALTKAGIEL